LLREPLLHFLVLGSLLFVAYGLLHPGAATAPREVVVSKETQANLRLQFERLRQRPPTVEEQRDLVDSFVREEILYREGVALGLERDDVIVRRRVAQKMEFIGNGQEPTAPTDAELAAFLQQNATKYLAPARYSLRQVFFDPSRHGDRLEADALAAKRAVRPGDTPVGDPSLLPAELDAAPAFEVERVFGVELLEALKDLPIGGWQGPVRSGRGLHLVELSQRDAARPATLEEARNEVERDLVSARAERGREEFFGKLRQKYEVRVEPGAEQAAAGGSVTSR
jgi:hypothetical protein